MREIPVLDYINGVFVCRSTYEQRTIPQQAKFWWHGGNCRPNCQACAAGIGKKWWTPKPEIAVQLRDIASPAALEALRPTLEAIEASRATDNTTVEIPVPDWLSYKPFQRAGIAVASTRAANLFADEPGLGKTIEAIGFINCHDDVRRVLIVCPATMKLVWRSELTKWLVKPRTIKIIKGSKSWDGSEDITIINYDLLKKYHARLLETRWDLLVADECHFLKNPKALRSGALYGHENRKEPAKSIPAVHAKYRICMSGTPLVNRPIELWSTIHYLDPERWDKFFPYALRYCAAHNNGFGWDLSGSSNLEELQRILRSTIMVRRLKQDVLTELPPKQRRIVPLEVTGDAAEALADEQEWWSSRERDINALELKVELAKANDNDSGYTAAVAELKHAMQVSFTEMSKVRHDVAVAKIPAVLEYIEESLGDDEKVVIFAHHHDVIEALAAKLLGSVVLYGATSATKRQEAIEKFQNDPKCRYFIGSIYAAGTGITLTASHHVIFAELDWVPGVISQAEDRTHRLGQCDSVLIEHLVFDGSLDSRMAKVLVEKQAVLDKALDWDTPFQMPETETVIPISGGSTRSTTRKTLDDVAVKLTKDDVRLVHTALRVISSVCDGAHALDDYGFNGLDTQIGKALAAESQLTARQAALGLKIVTKYARTQLPEQLCDSILALKARVK